MTATHASVEPFRADDGQRPTLHVFHNIGLRIVFLLIAAFLLSTAMPSLLSPQPSSTAGVARALLAALGLLALAGVLYPARMLPIMMFELLWKVLWLAFVGFPMWRAGTLDPASRDTFTDLLIGVGLVLIVFPYRYAWTQYVRRPRWRE